MWVLSRDGTQAQGSDGPPRTPAATAELVHKYKGCWTLRLSEGIAAVTPTGAPRRKLFSAHCNS